MTITSYLAYFFDQILAFVEKILTALPGAFDAFLSTLLN